MPNTPFLGLSVLLHICIIFGYKIFSWLPKRVRVMGKHMSKKRKGSLKIFRAISISTIVIVFLFVVANAAFLVRASIVDKHSSIRFVGNVAGRTIASVRSGSTKFALKAPNNKKIEASVPVHEVSESAVLSDCVEAPLYQDLNYKLSLVDYLKMKDEDSSFEAREKIARSMGMEDYGGTLPENQMILGWFLSIAKSCEKSSVPLAND